MSAPGPPNITQIPFASPNMLEFEWGPPLVPNGTILGYRFTINGAQTILGADARYYAATGLTNGETYFTSLEASNANGWGTPANFRNYQPGSEPTQGPSTFTVDTFGSNALASWTPPAVLPDAPILWYALYGEDPYLNASFSYTANGLTQSNYYINLSSMADYYNYSIYAVNCPGWSPVVSYPAPKQRGTPEWATRISGGLSQTQTNEGIITDINNNVYAVGQYIGSLNVYSYNSAPVDGGSVGLSYYGTLSNNDANSNDTYFIKYNSSGTVQWVSRIGSLNSQNTPVVATDVSGNVYVSGTNTATYIQFNNPGSVDASKNILVTVAGNMSTLASTNDIYLAKYNSSGTFQWATVIGSATNEQFPSICTDPFGNVYVGGDYDGTTTIRNAGTPDVNLNVATTAYGTMARTGSNDSFLVKFNSNGAAQWATRLGSTGNETSVSIIGDISGNTYILNSYNNAALSIFNSSTPSGGVITPGLFGTLPFTGATLGQADLALVKYTSSGTVSWATRLSSSTNTDYPQYITTDTLGNVYAAAQYISLSSFTIFNGSSTLNATSTIQITTYAAMSNTNLTTPVTGDVCLVKYNPTGAVQWVTRIGGLDSEGETTLTTDSFNNLYVAGTTNASTVATIYNKNAPSGGFVNPLFYANLSNTNPSSINTFLVKYDTDGNAQWGTMIGGTANDITPTISADSLGNVYVSGNYNSKPFNIYKPALTPTLNNSTIGLSLYGSLDKDGSSGGAFDVYLIKFQT
jgi:hypothetical protein